MANRELQKTDEAKVQELIPPVDVYENGQGYLLHFDLPGAQEKDVRLTIEQGRVSLEVPVQHPQRGRIAYRRQFGLPSMIDAEKVQATISSGVLTLELPKNADSRETRVPIKAG